MAKEVRQELSLVLSVGSIPTGASILNKDITNYVYI